MYATEMPDDFVCVCFFFVWPYSSCALFFTFTVLPIEMFFHWKRQTRHNSCEMCFYVKRKSVKYGFLFEHESMHMAQFYIYTGENSVSIIMSHLKIKIVQDHGSLTQFVYYSGKAKKIPYSHCKLCSHYHVDLVDMRANKWSLTYNLCISKAL